MRMRKWVFLLSYIIYLLWAIAYAIVNKESAIIDTLIFSVTIASTIFSISDLVYTKFEIDKRETDETIMLLNLVKKCEKICTHKLETKYGEEVRKKFSDLEKILGKEELEKIVSSKLTQSEEIAYLKKVNDVELRKFLANLLQSQKETDTVLEESDDSHVVEMIKFIKRREKIYFSLPSILVVLGLVCLLIILTLRVEPQPFINNICTLIAFLSVIVGLMLRECYKAKELENLVNERKEIINVMKEN